MASDTNRDRIVDGYQQGNVPWKGKQSKMKHKKLISALALSVLALTSCGELTDYPYYSSSSTAQPTATAPSSSETVSSSSQSGSETSSTSSAPTPISSAPVTVSKSIRIADNTGYLAQIRPNTIVPLFRLAPSEADAVLPLGHSIKVETTVSTSRFSYDSARNLIGGKASDFLWLFNVDKSDAAGVAKVTQTLKDIGLFNRQYQTYSGNAIFDPNFPLNDPTFYVRAVTPGLVTAFEDPSTQVVTVVSSQGQSGQSATGLALLNAYLNGDAAKPVATRPILVTPIIRAVRVSSFSLIGGVSASEDSDPEGWYVPYASTYSTDADTNRGRNAFAQGTYRAVPVPNDPELLPLNATDLDQTIIHWNLGDYLAQDGNVDADNGISVKGKDDAGDGASKVSASFSYKDKDGVEKTAVAEKAYRMVSGVATGDELAYSRFSIGKDVFNLDMNWTSATFGANSYINLKEGSGLPQNLQSIQVNFVKTSGFSGISEIAIDLGSSAFQETKVSSRAVRFTVDDKSPKVISKTVSIDDLGIKAGEDCNYFSLVRVKGNQSAALRIQSIFFLYQK